MARLHGSLLVLAGAVLGTSFGCRGGQEQAKEQPPAEVPARCWALHAVSGLDFRTDAWVASVAVGDFDEDGKPDLAAAAGRGDTVTVLRGAGDGTFTPGGSFATGAGPAWAVASARLTRPRPPASAHVDLAVANFGAATVSILRGKGDGTFEAGVEYATGAGPVALLAADVSGAGSADLVTANWTAGTVSVLRGNGDGTFQPKVDVPVGAHPAAVAAGDLDGDGKLDLVVAEHGSGGIRVLRGTGGGLFSAGAAVPTGAGAWRVALADVDGDGKLDAVVANRDEASVAVLAGRGDGSFGAPTYHVAGATPSAIAVTDLDGNGWPDLVLANAAVDNLLVYPATGHGTFAAARPHSAGVLAPHALAVADLDGDGRPDLVLLNQRVHWDPPYTAGAFPALDGAYPLAVLRNVCELPLEVFPVRLTAMRWPSAWTVWAQQGGAPVEVDWSLEPAVGTLSSTHGAVVTYTPPSAPGPLEEAWLVATSGSKTVRSLVRVSPLAAVPIGTAGAPNGYLEYLPPGYGDGTPRPLLVDLHGSGAEGNGAKDLSNVIWGQLPALIASGEWPAARPFVVLAPQHHAQTTDCFNADEIRSFLAWAVGHYAVDPKRVYLTGYSCGAYGAWSYTGWYNGDGVVAAEVLVAGSPEQEWDRAHCALGNVAIWAIHGDADPTVPYGPEQVVMSALTACPSPPRREVDYTLVPGAGHGIAWQVFNGALGLDVYWWLLANALP